MIESHEDAGLPDAESDARSFEQETIEEPEAVDRQPRPVGAGQYEVKQGDCVASIAFERGHFWKTIWNHPSNATLREVRKNPYVLLPGDRLHIPPLRPKVESGSTGQRHRFRRKGVPEKLHIRLLDEDDKPLAGVAYVIEIDGRSTEGLTGANGDVVQAIPPNAKKGKIILKELGEEIPLSLGWLDPTSELSGVQARLNNLGYDAGEEDGRWDAGLVEAIRAFQEDNSLPVTGELDDGTRSKLAQLYGG